MFRHKQDDSPYTNQILSIRPLYVRVAPQHIWYFTQRFPQLSPCVSKPPRIMIGDMVESTFVAGSILPQKRMFENAR